MRHRGLILAAAVVLGISAALLAAQYLRSASSRLAREAEPVEVLVAVKAAARGASAEELVRSKAIETRAVPRQYVAENAVSSLAAIEGQVLAVDVSAGEQITRAKFAYPSQAGIAYSIPEGLVAVSIPADDVKCVSGSLKPGDTVMVLATFDPGPDGKQPETRILLPKAKVLAVNGQLVQTQEEKQASRGLASTASNGRSGTVPTVTLALSPADVVKLVFAEEQGSVWLSLLPPTATQAPAVSGRTLKSIFE
ncbi:MAG: Flp pilus assembly protein CpaB [Coriobacteriia bacterium]|nr:Flp pilus assembly protein CpaB [Coriobacteriia bacterium]